MRDFTKATVTIGCVLFLLSAPGLRGQGPPHPPLLPPTLPATTPAAQPSPRPSAPSALQQPAQPAKIRFDAYGLFIHADNSSLSAILREFSGLAGMKIDGLTGDERVFGDFGPGKPFDVLSTLLNGTAYDVFMVGSLSNGAPRELILSPPNQASGAPAPLTSPGVSSGATPDGDDADANDEDTSDTSQDSGPPANPPGVRSAQELFEQLQAMRAQQQLKQQETQQQQQQQQQQQPQRPEPPEPH